MWSLIAALVQFVCDVYREWREASLRDQGGKTVEQEAKDNASTVAADVAKPDLDRDQRLRNRFDRAADASENQSG